MSIQELTATASEQALEVLRQAQEIVLDAVKNFTAAVESVRPELPALPFADALPDAGAIVTGAVELAEKATTAQIAFVKELVAAAKPLFSPKSN